MPEIKPLVVQYIASLQEERERDYAGEYARWLLLGRAGEPEPFSGDYGITFRIARAIRISIHAFSRRP